MITKDFIQEKLNLLEAKDLETVNFLARHNRASEIGHPCLRYLYLLRTMSVEQSLKLWRLFKVGREFEEVIIKKLLQILPVKAFQRPVEDKELCLAGVLDVLLENDEPIEIKSCGKYSFSEIYKFSEKPVLLRQADILYRKYYFQVQSYLFMLDVEKGFLFVKDRESGNELLIEVVRDEEAIKEIKTKCEKINEAYEKQILPIGIFLKDVCSQCFFYKEICEKEFKKDKKVEVVNLSEDFLDKLDRYFVLKEQLKALEKLEKEIKEKIKSWEDGIYIINGRPYKINVTGFSRMYLNLPEDVKKELEKQYGEERVYKRIEIK